MILPALSPGVVNALEPQIRALCNRLLDAFEGDEINANSGYAQFIPAGVIHQMLGFPEDDVELFLEFVHIVMEGVASAADVDLAIQMGYEF